MNKGISILSGGMLVALYLIAGISHLAAQESLSNGKKRAKELIRRNVEVSAVQNSVGISSGLVVAYGHPLSQPYQFAYRGSILYVNGVQVEPTLIMQREYDKSHAEKMSPTKATELTQLQNIANTAREYYFTNVDNMDKAILQAKVLKMVTTHPLVKEARWLNEKQIVYTSKEDPYRFTNGINFSIHASPPVAQARKSTKEIHKERIDEFEDQLRSGGCIFFGTIGAWLGSKAQCGDVKSAVAKILDQSSVSEAEKETKLRKIFGGSKDEPLDIMSNYRNGEWK